MTNRSDIETIGYEPGEARVLTEGMIAIRYLAGDMREDRTRLIGEIADAMHNGFDPTDQMRFQGAKQGLAQLFNEHPELQRILPRSYAWVFQ